MGIGSSSRAGSRDLGVHGAARHVNEPPGPRLPGVVGRPLKGRHVHPEDVVGRGREVAPPGRLGEVDQGVVLARPAGSSGRRRDRSDGTHSMPGTARQQHRAGRWRAPAARGRRGAGPGAGRQTPPRRRRTPCPCRIQSLTFTSACPGPPHAEREVDVVTLPRFPSQGHYPRGSTLPGSPVSLAQSRQQARASRWRTPPPCSAARCIGGLAGPTRAIADGPSPAIPTPLRPSPAARSPAGTRPGPVPGREEHETGLPIAIASRAK